MTHSRIQLTLLSVFSIFRAKKAIFKEESTLSMGPRLWENILEIQQIESGTLAKFWSDGRNVAKVIANLVQPFCQKQALVTSLQCIFTFPNEQGVDLKVPGQDNCKTFSLT